jgi:hypothetical protein
MVLNLVDLIKSRYLWSPTHDDRDDQCVAIIRHDDRHIYQEPVIRKDFLSDRGRTNYLKIRELLTVSLLSISGVTRTELTRHVLRNIPDLRVHLQVAARDMQELRRCQSHRDVSIRQCLKEFLGEEA